MTPEQQILLDKAARSLQAARELNNVFPNLQPPVPITLCSIWPPHFSMELDFPTADTQPSFLLSAYNLLGLKEFQ